MKRLGILGTAIMLASCGPAPEAPATPATPEITRPTFELATSEAYDLGAIQAYPGQHSAVYDYIDANLPDHLAALQRWLRQPSISAQDVGIDEMAELLRAYLEELQRFGDTPPPPDAEDLAGELDEHGTPVASG